MVVAELSRHLSAEEQYLYPAVRKVVPDGDLLADRELAEDHDLLVTLRNAGRRSPGDRASTRLAGEVVRGGPPARGRRTPSELLPR